MLLHSLPNSHFNCLYKISLCEHILRNLLLDTLVITFDFFNTIINEVVTALDLELKGYKNDFSLHYLSPPFLPDRAPCIF